MPNVTVIVTTYNPMLNKALETINSIILQEEVRLQIIIADDCSSENYFDAYRAFFDKKGFEDYLLLESNENHGTIKNLLRCVEACKGDYIKMISPGDYLYGATVLRDWAGYMEQRKLLMTVGDAFYYVREDSGYRLIKEHAFPQAPKVLNHSNERKKKFYQLIYNDYWLGAATLIERETFVKYINIVKGLAVYGEDNMYRIAACDGISRGYYPKQVIMYEADTGVSSLGDKGSKWHYILMDEWVKTNEYLLDRLDVDKRFLRKYEWFLSWKKQNFDIRSSKLNGKNPMKLIAGLIPLYVHIPELLLWSIRRVLFKRITSVNIDNDIVMKIFDV